MSKYDELIQIFEELTGEKYCIDNVKIINKMNFDPFKDGNGITFNRMNELLLLFGFNRIKLRAFFKFLIGDKIIIKDGKIQEDAQTLEPLIQNMDHLRESVKNFHVLALLFYGNVKMAYDELSTNIEMLDYYLKHTYKENELAFKERCEPINNLINIPAEKTYLLGHILSTEVGKLKKKENKTQEDQLLINEWDDWTEKGKINFNNYLTFDFLDIYVATSMRDKHEYYMVNKISNEIFNGHKLKDYKIRYFDPTQAFCTDRIDKGLSEALMLKRAKGTLYLVQEIDTLGKDSELASTLAQGKPVIAYVPQGNEKDLSELIEAFKLLNDFDEKTILLELLKIFAKNLAWDKEETKLREWIADNKSINKEELRNLVLNKMKIHYDKRADLLKDQHPLGIQVNLETGVANGLLVVRNIEDCCSLILNILLNNFEFDVKYLENPEEGKYLLLQERLSGSIFRIITGNNHLTNSFWNFYKNSKE